MRRPFLTTVLINIYLHLQINTHKNHLQHTKPSVPFCKQLSGVLRAERMSYALSSLRKCIETRKWGKNKL